MSAQWEEKDFVFKYDPGEMWCRVGPKAYTEAAAKKEFWDNSQRRILPLLKLESDAGWEPISEVGPSSISIDVKRSLGKSPGEVFFSLFGIAYSIGFYALMLPWFATPFECRIRLRRKR